MTVPLASVAGLVFPADPSKRENDTSTASTGRTARGSTYGNKGAWAAAIGAVNKAEAEKITKEKNWRKNYPRYVRRHVEESLKSRDNAIRVAKAGLQFCYDEFEFVRDGTTTSLNEAMAKYTKETFHTAVIKGNGEKEAAEFSVPYGFGNLTGMALLNQLDRWAENGTIEPSARDAIAAVAKHPEWLDLSDMYFVLLGAGSAMGPFLTLMAHGANIVAIDLDRPKIWKRLIDVARKSPGSLIFPVKKDPADLTNDEEIAGNAGCNLFTQAPEIRNWLLELYPEKQMIVGAYAYLDGELHVKVSLAMDAIIRDMTEKRKAGAAYLCTPTDVHTIPKEAHDAALHNYDTLVMSKLMKPFLKKNALPPVVADAEGGRKKEFYIVNGIVGRQGPNYALAKRIQHWRAMVAREESGVIVSSNIAPSTSTPSVTNNKLFAMAYLGMDKFKPMEIATPELSNAVMAALLIHDVRVAQRYEKEKGGLTKLDNPLQLMSGGAFHGGVWRAAFTIESMGTPSLIFSLLTRPPAVFIVSVLVGMVLGMLVKAIQN